MELPTSPVFSRLFSLNDYEKPSDTLSETISAELQQQDPSTNNGSISQSSSPRTEQPQLQLQQFQLKSLTPSHPQGLQLTRQIQQQQPHSQPRLQTQQLQLFRHQQFKEKDQKAQPKRLPPLKSVGIQREQVIIQSLGVKVSFDDSTEQFTSLPTTTTTTTTTTSITATAAMPKPPLLSTTSTSPTIVAIDDIRNLKRKKDCEESLDDLFDVKGFFSFFCCGGVI
eukprot:TRINITY_DN4492_c1_g1_i7.p1 TRINITY_DN4492_c1_g1~~TRINITY_DN4492_c1_g1_i7.p1  ORF type:complete len:236 (-),score=58.60 TRINITY_DN4492_c1_g1_i7:90-764(-)